MIHYKMDKTYLIDFIEDGLKLKFLKGMNKMYNKLVDMKNRFYSNDDLKDYMEIFIRWINNRASYYDDEKQKTYTEFVYSNVRKLSCIDFPLLKISPLTFIDPIWDFRYDNFIHRLPNDSHSAKREKVIYTSLTIAQGNFRDVILYKVGPMYFMATFYIPLGDKSLLVFSILPERYIERIDEKIPKSEWQWTYHQYIRFLDIVESPDKIDKVLENLFTPIYYNANRCQIFLDVHNLRHLPFFNEEQTLDAVVDMECKIKSSVIMGTGKVKPRFQDYFIKIENRNSLEYKTNAQSWVCLGEIYESPEDSNYRPIPSVRYHKSKVGKKENLKLVNEKSYKWLATFIQQIPNFHVRV